MYKYKHMKLILKSPYTKNDSFSSPPPPKKAWQPTNQPKDKLKSNDLLRNKGVNNKWIKFLSKKNKYTNMWFSYSFTWILFCSFEYIKRIPSFGQLYCQILR